MILCVFVITLLTICQGRNRDRRKGHYSSREKIAVLGGVNNVLSMADRGHGRVIIGPGKRGAVGRDINCPKKRKQLW